MWKQEICKNNMIHVKTREFQKMQRNLWISALRQDPIFDGSCEFQPFHEIMLFSLKITKIAQCSEIHLFSLIFGENAPWAPRADSALEYNGLGRPFWAILGKITNFGWFYPILVIFGEFPPISRFLVKITLFRVFANSRASGSDQSCPRSDIESEIPERLHY